MLTRLRNSPATTIFLIRVFGAGIAYCAQILLARWLSPHDNGVYIQYISVITILVGVLMFGFDSSPQHYIPYYKHENKKNLIHGFIHTAKLSAVILSSAFTLIVSIIIYFIDIPLEQKYAIILAALITIPWTLTEVQSAIARSWNLMWLATAPVYLIKVTLLFLAVGICIIEKLHASYVQAIALTLFVAIFTCIYQYIAMRKVTHAHIKSNNREYDLKEWIKYNKNITVITACYMTMIFSDVIIIGFFSTPVDVAIYYIASKTIVLSAFIQYAIGSAANHNFSAAYAQRDKAALQELMNKTSKHSFLFTLSCSIIIMLLSPYILYLFGPVYSNGNIYIILLSFVTILRSSIGPADRLMLMAKAQKKLSHNLIVVLCVTISLQVIFAWQYGPIGVAVATVLACLFEVVLLRYSAKSALGIECFVGLQYLAKRTAAAHVTSAGLSALNTSAAYATDNIFASSPFISAIAQAQPAFSNAFLHHNTESEGQLLVSIQRKFGLKWLESGIHNITPLNSAGVAVPCATAFWQQFFMQARTHSHVIELNHLPAADAPYVLAAIESVPHTILHHAPYARAMLVLNPQRDGDAYLKEHIRPKKYKEYNRLLRRLAERGTVQCAYHSAPHTIHAAFERLLTLEASGWKGKRGTAIAQSPSISSMMQALLAQVHSAGQVAIFELYCDAQLIASGIVLFSGTTGYFYKMAYDEAFSAYSPGVLLTLELTKHLHTIEGLERVDSCALPHHPLIDHIWKQRQELRHLIIALTPTHHPRTWAARCYVVLRHRLRPIIKKLVRKKHVA